MTYEIASGLELIAAFFTLLYILKLVLNETEIGSFIVGSAANEGPLGHLPPKHCLRGHVKGQDVDKKSLLNQVIYRRNAEALA